MSADWVSTVSAFAGVLIGSGVTLFTEGSRARREQSQLLNRDRQDAYLQYLTASSACQQELRKIAFGDSSAQNEHAYSLREAFQDSGVYAAREKIRVFSTLSVASAAENAFDALRQYRDILIRGVTSNSSEHLDAREAVSEANFRLRSAIRAELALNSESGEILLKRASIERSNNLRGNS